VCCGIKPATEIKSNGRESHAIRYCEECRNRLNDLRSQRRQELKIEVLTHYGPKSTLKCSWFGCDVVDIDMLTLDHINNDGWEEKPGSARAAGGVQMYSALKNEGYPAGFQTLCHNHQWKKEMENRRILSLFK